MPHFLQNASVSHSKTLGSCAIPNPYFCTRRCFERLFQRLPQFPASPRRPRLRRGLRNIKCFSSFSNRETLDVAETEDNSRVCGELSDPPCQNAIQFIPRTALFGVWTPILKLVRENSFFSIIKAIERSSVPTALAHSHKTLIDRDTHEPSAKARVSAKTRYVPECLYERILYDVFGVLPIVSNPLSHSKQLCLISLHELLKSDPGPALRLGDEISLAVVRIARTM